MRKYLSLGSALAMGVVLGKEKDTTTLSYMAEVQAATSAPKAVEALVK
jgi:hypothetical protein